MQQMCDRNDPGRHIEREYTSERCFPMYITFPGSMQIDLLLLSLAYICVIKSIIHGVNFVPSET
jgi:hypothetical protein